MNPPSLDRSIKSRSVDQALIDRRRIAAARVRKDEKLQGGPDRWPPSPLRQRDSMRNAQARIGLPLTSCYCRAIRTVSGYRTVAVMMAMIHGARRASADLIAGVEAFADDPDAYPDPDPDSDAVPAAPAGGGRP